MAKKNKNQMYVILGILIVGLIFLGPQLGLFSTQEVCTSNEPTNIQDFQSLLEQIQSYDCIYFEEGGAENVFCGNITATDDSIRDDYINVALQYSGFGNIEEVTCSDFMAENLQFEYRTTIHGIDIYYGKNHPFEEIEPNWNSFCSEDNQFIIGVNSLEKFEHYFNTFYTCEDVDGNGNGEQSFDINNELFNLGEFSVTWLIVFIAIGGIFLIVLIKK